MREKRIVIGSDHAGLPLKLELQRWLTASGWIVEDVGCTTAISVDYPDYAVLVGQKVAQGDPPVGVLVCGTGIGMSIAANKVPGVRAALCHETFSAEMARAHNDANVLCLGGRVLGPELARAVLEKFLTASFQGGRHQQRLDKITAAESRSGSDEP